MWLKEGIVQELWRRFLRIPKKVTGERLWNKMTRFFDTFCDRVMLGMKGGLEIANYYSLHPHPLTERKVKLLRRKLLLNYFCSCILMCF
jgi:hypothetical protein